MLRGLHLLFEFCCLKSTPCPFGVAAEGWARLSLRGSRVRDLRGFRDVAADASARTDEHPGNLLGGSPSPDAGWTAGRFGWSGILGRLTCVLFWMIACGNAWSQLVETFDNGAPRFSLWRDDARAVLQRPPKTEPGVESWEVQSGNGSFIYLACPIEPSGIIPELNASIRIRSAEKGYRIGFRIVFPHARHPATHAPLTEVILGSPHEGAGRWSLSTIGNVVPLLEDRQRYLRRRDGPDTDLRDPYVDAVILSVYGLPGISRFQLDDLVVEGMIAPGVVVDSEEAMRGGATPGLPTNEQLRMLQSKVPRWIQHQGESLAFLQSLGFNAVISTRNNDRLVLDQASETGMGVIMPPPTLAPTESQADQYRSVSAWLLGLSLNQSQMDAARNRVTTLSRFPVSLTRPTVGEAWEMYGSYSRLSDWIAVPMPLATTVRSSRETSQILQSDLRPIAGRNTPITSLWTQMPNEWVAQRQMVSSILGRDPWLLPDHDRLQARLQLMRSIMQGSRGWIFRSPTPLDAGDETSATRADSFAGLNREIELLMPWIQAGESKWRPLAVSSNEHAASILETPNSQLVIVLAAGNSDQICSPAPAQDRITITLPISGQPREVYRITHGELERCATQSTTGGMVVAIDRPGLVEQIVSVVDTGPVTYLREALSRGAPEMADNRIDIATQLMQIAQMSMVAQQLPPEAPAWEQIRRAQTEARAASNFLVRSEFPRACRAADQAALLAQRVIRSSWEDAVAQFNSVSSSPLVASPLGLPLHWELDRVLQGRDWELKPIPGVPFTTLDTWRALGWRSDHRLEETIESSVGITAEVGPAGLPTMLVAAKSRTGQPIPSGYAGASMRVTSPRISVPLGAMIHIEGLVQVVSPSDQSQAGLLIGDNYGGEALGQLISSYDRTDETWRRISLFRMATHADGLELYFETRGQVQAAITDLSIQMIMPTQNRSLPISTISIPEINE